VNHKDSPGIAALKDMTRAERDERRHGLWEHHVLYLCRCGSGTWYTRTDLLPDSFPCGAPCFGTMERQKPPEWWQEQAREEATE